MWVYLIIIIIFPSAADDQTTEQQMWRKVAPNDLFTFTDGKHFLVFINWLNWEKLNQYTYIFLKLNIC